MPNINGIPELMTMIGNPGQMFEPQIHNNILPDVKKDGLSQYIVRLTSNDDQRSVRGLLTENFSINVDATWDALDIIGGITTHPFLAGIAKIGGLFAQAQNVANPANTGISTRKTYTQSGYLELDIKFRVVDWRGKGDPVKAAFILSSMCLPTNLKSYTARQTLTQGIPDAIPKVGPVTSALNTDASNAANWVVGAFDKPAEGIEPLIQPLADIANNPQFLVLASGPSTITVQIGNYFKHNDIIVKNVKSDFSKQATSAGPLYADFDITMSSRQTLLMRAGTNADGTKTGVDTTQDIGLMVKGRRRVMTLVAVGTP